MSESAPSTSSPPSSSAADDEINLNGANPVLFAQMIEMGIARNLAIKSLLLSGNNSIEAAFTWFSEYSPEELEQISLTPFEADSDQWVDLEDDKNGSGNSDSTFPKMILVANSELKMKPGKIAAQVGHAVLDLYRRISSRGTRSDKGLLGLWSSNGEIMVVVKGESTQHLQDLKSEAESKKIANYLVTDAGRTQVAEGSQTILAMFGPSNKLDSITGKLKLL